MASIEGGLHEPNNLAQHVFKLAGALRISVFLRTPRGREVCSAPFSLSTSKGHEGRMSAQRFSHSSQKVAVSRYSGFIVFWNDSAPAAVRASRSRRARAVVSAKPPQEGS